MDIISTYNQLKEKDINLDLLSEISELRDFCEEENNKEYYFLCSNLIIKILINEGLLDDALKTAVYTQSLFDDYKSIYQEIYKELLDNLAYIYITNQNYLRALEVEHLKKEFLDSSKQEEVNRWLLECSYIHEAIGEKNEALTKLKAILMNNPTDFTKSVALSNLIKLYIDLNDLSSAKEKLVECFDLVNRINDNEGIRYCEYLNGKINHLEKNYEESYVFLSKLVDGITQLDSENFNYLNEFISLLSDMEKYQEGLNLASKYLDIVNSSTDLENRLVFYKSYLRLNLLINKKKKGFFDYTQLLDQINMLETEMLKNKNIKTTELRENDLLIESENSAKTISKKLVEGIESLDFKAKDSIRSFLIKYSYSLVNKIPMDEIQYYLFDKSVSTVLPVLPTNINLISSYQYRNNRLYERKINYRDIEKTAILKIIEEQKLFSCDLSKPSNSYVDAITGNDFTYNYLVAIPLFNDQGIFGCALHLSKSDYIVSNFSLAFLKTAALVFESHLVNLLFIENNKLENKLLATATNELNYGIFYYNDYNKKMFLSDNLKNILNLSNEIFINQYNSLVLQSDLEEYSKKHQAISAKTGYSITYHLNINNENVLFREQANPIELNNSLYYVGTIDKVIIDDVINEINRDKLLSISELKRDLERKKNKSFVGLVIKSNLSKINIVQKDDYLYHLSSELKDHYQTAIYLMDDMFVLLFDDYTVKDLKKKITKSLFKKYDCKYTILQYPKLLVRLDDFIGFAKFILKQEIVETEIEFSNELYAKYISVCTINSCVNTAIVNDNVDLLAQHVTLDSQLVGYFITPNIMGVYNDPNVLKVIDKELQYKLDEYIINQLECKDFISIYSLSLDSLLNICTGSVKEIKENAKIVFEIKEVDSIDPLMINQIIQILAKTKCRLIISSRLLKAITIDNLINNGSVILGFNEVIDENYLHNYKEFITPYYFNILNGLKIGKVIRKLSELNI